MRRFSSMVIAASVSGAYPASFRASVEAAIAKGTLRDVFAFMRLHPVKFIEIFNFAGNFHRQVAGVEARNSGDTALAAQYRAAERVVAVPIRTQASHSGNDYASQHGFDCI